MKHLKEVLKHEFADYELEISLSYTYTTFMKDMIGLTENEIKENQNEIREAIEEYKEEFYKYN